MYTYKVFPLCMKMYYIKKIKIKEITPRLRRITQGVFFDKQCFSY